MQAHEPASRPWRGAEESLVAHPGLEAILHRRTSRVVLIISLTAYDKAAGGQMIALAVAANAILDPGDIFYWLSPL